MGWIEITLLIVFAPVIFGFLAIAGQVIFWAVVGPWLFVVDEIRLRVNPQAVPLMSSMLRAPRRPYRSTRKPVDHGR